ncbi:MAG: hypothetical protein AAF802_24360 [Planctomycetota bacterium]
MGNNQDLEIASNASWCTGFSRPRLRNQRRRKKKNPTGRRIKRDGWLSPLTLSPTKLSSEPQINRQGVRSSDRGSM